VAVAPPPALFSGERIGPTPQASIPGAGCLTARLLLEWFDVIEFNGKAASAACAHAPAVQPEDLAGQFMAQPRGLIVAGEPLCQACLARRRPHQVAG
jgi:hypothetical protein